MKLSEYSNLADQEVVNGIVKENRPELFRLLYDRYHKKVFDKCRNLVKDRKLAEEFVQDIFSKVFEKLDKFRGQASFSSWLYAITYNHCIEYLRMKHKLHYPEWDRRQGPPETIDEQEEDFGDMKYERLMQILEMIHPEEKALLMMKYQDNISLKLIETALRISESAVKMRLKRAKARVIYLYNTTYKEKIKVGKD